jgi:GNAT superfamily N-acetyltransferase
VTVADKIVAALSANLRDGYTDVPPGKIASVVTSLEMLQPAPLRREPAAIATLRRVERPDTGWYRELYRRIGEPHLWFSRLCMADSALAEIIRHPEVEIYVVSSDDSDAGLFELDLRKGDDCELAFFGLVPAQVGKGVGRWLMNRALEAAWSKPIQRLWVHTCTLDHPGALDFYIRSGFKPFHRRIEVADDPRLTGVLSPTAAPHIPLIRR